MDSEDRANAGDRRLDDRVSTFGESLLELDDEELERQAEAYLGFDGSWGKDGR